jgi:hypothetical protein
MPVAGFSTSPRFLRGLRISAFRFNSTNSPLPPPAPTHRGCGLGGFLTFRSSQSEGGCGEIFRGSWMIVDVTFRLTNIPSQIKNQQLVLRSLGEEGSSIGHFSSFSAVRLSENPQSTTRFVLQSRRFSFRTSTCPCSPAITTTSCRRS